GLRGGRGLAGSSVGARAPGRGRPPGPARRSARPWAARAWARPPPRRPPRPGLAVTAVSLFGTTFQNSVLLASGTAAFGREVRGVIDLDALGGIVTKAVTPEPRQGNHRRASPSSRAACSTPWGSRTRDWRPPGPARCPGWRRT